MTLHIFPITLWGMVLPLSFVTGNGQKVFTKKIKLLIGLFYGVLSCFSMFVYVLFFVGLFLKSVDNMKTLKLFLNLILKIDFIF